MRKRKRSIVGLFPSEEQRTNDDEGEEGVGVRASFSRGRIDENMEDMWQELLEAVLPFLEKRPEALHAEQEASEDALPPAQGEPAAPDRGFATASREASVEELKLRLSQLRHKNLLGLKENERLLQEYERGIIKLEKEREIMETRDAQRDEAARLQKEELEQVEMEFVRKFWKDVSEDD